MEKILYVKWDSGYMNIRLDNFFPCEQARFKKLLKVIALDWQHEAELKEDLKVYFQNRIVEFGEMRKESGKKYFDLKQKAADTQRMIQSKKRPNGVGLSKEELKQAREELKEQTAAYKEALADANRYLKFRERIQKHLEFLQSV